MNAEVVLPVLGTPSMPVQPASSNEKLPRVPPSRPSGPIEFMRTNRNSPPAFMKCLPLLKESIAIGWYVLFRYVKGPVPLPRPAKPEIVTDGEPLFPVDRTKS